jgi:dethiobiotin synthetase
MTAIFITGTGTDIGKTFVAAGLIRHWRAAGRHVDALKPVATGFNPTDAEKSDTGILLAALGRPISPAEIERVSPWRFAAPLSPDMAARREGRSVDFNAVVEFSRKALAANTDMLIIEGIGGIMVPLDRRHTVLDWMIALQIPLVVVTGTYLGSLSHTLTCLDVLTARGLGVKALVVNDTPGSAITHQATTDTLLNFVRPIPIIIGMRQLFAGQRGDGIFADIAKSLDNQPG